jgi:hypothetical protein
LKEAYKEECHLTGERGYANVSPASTHTLKQILEELETLSFVDLPCLATKLSMSNQKRIKLPEFMS